MSRFCIIVLMLVFVHTTLCKVVKVRTNTASVCKKGDIPKNTQSLTNELKATDENTCAKVGEFCTISDICCSKICLNYAKKCVPRIAKSLPSLSEE